MPASKYESAVASRIDEIKAWLRDGYTQKEIAKKLNIGERTLIRYRDAHKDLKELFKKTKEYVDKVEMVGAYKMRAQGYTVETARRKYIYKMNPDGTQTKVLVSEEIKEVHVPGDPRAMEFWLRHRLKDEWGGDVIQETQDSGVIILPERDNE